MIYNKILEVVKNTNKQLLSIGFTWNMIDDFWDECLIEAKQINEQEKKKKVQRV